MKNTFIETLSNLFSQKSDKEPKKDGDKNDKAIAKEPLKYIPLTPIKLDTEDAKHYISALTWAVDNEDIRNIALTGTYGSGKSSILKTFEKSNKNEKNKFLTISLANFSETSEILIDDKTKIKNKKLQTGKLEEQIFLQLHYTIGNDKLPNSRFRKINNNDLLLSIKFSALLFSILLSSIYVINNKSLYNLFFHKYLIDIFSSSLYSNLNKNDILQIIISIVALLISSYGLFLLIRTFSRLINSFQKLKVKFFETEIEVGSESSSFLSQHLDEVMYFFEKTKKNIVIFEDLDRFNNTEIFIKLRELNSLINSYEPIINSGKGVKFIYAIRDDVFLRKTEPNSLILLYQLYR